MLAQAKKYGAGAPRGGRLQGRLLNGVFRVKTESWEYQSKTLILATAQATGGFLIPRGQSTHEGRSLLRLLRRGALPFRNSTIAVIGYGNGVRPGRSCISGSARRSTSSTSGGSGGGGGLPRADQEPHQRRQWGRADPILCFVTMPEFRARGKVRPSRWTASAQRWASSPNVDLPSI